jgi:TPR repeat protein
MHRYAGGMGAGIKRRSSRMTTLLITLALTMGLAPVARADNPSVVLNPPKLDYAAVCRPADVARPRLTQDWTKWNGKGLGLSVKDAIAIASEYASGSDRVQRSAPTALKILLEAERIYPAKKLSLQMPIARAVLRDAKDAAALDEVERRFLYAYERGSVTAAYALGQFYGDGGPAPKRDVTKARYFFEKSALASDPDGLIEYARLVTLDPNSTDETKRLVVTNALIGLIGEVRRGDCRVLGRIGYLYFRGNIVNKDIATALKWFEAHARSGNTKAALDLSRFYTSGLVDQVDSKKTMTYLRQAADGGIASAQIGMGEAYATGISVPFDRDRAIHYFEAASAQGFSEADEWLARLYSGDYGGKPDPALARQYFDKVLSSGKSSEQLSVTYANFLSENQVKPGDLETIVAILEKAGDAGSIDARTSLGRLYLDLGKQDRLNYAKAISYFQSAAAFGNLDAASKLAEMYACGKGVPISIERANEWRRKAAIFGSTNSIYLAGLNLIEGIDPVSKAKGRSYVRQAAFKGNAEAIGYSVARLEKGADGFDLNPDAAAKLLKFVAASADPALSKKVAFALIRNRFDVATSETEKLEQIAALAPYLKAGEIDAYVTESEMLEKAGKVDPARQLEISRFLAEKGDRRGMREYGRLLLQNPDLDVSVGRGWLEKASAKGDLKARLTLLDIADPSAEKQLSEIAASSEICKIDDMVSVAQTYFSIPDPKARIAAKYWLDLARSIVGRNSDDLYAIGSAYLAGVGGTNSIADAEDLYLRAVELGRKSVLRELAEGHLQKRWRKSSPEKAKQYLLELYALGDKEAANKFVQEVADGSIRSDTAEVEAVSGFLGPELKSPGKVMLKLARLNLEGKIGPKDQAVALKWLRISGDAGEPNAMYRLFQTYFFGIGVSRDVPAAFGWLEKAAVAGKPQAIKELAVAYEVGVDGFPPDAKKAAYWQARLSEAASDQ